MVLPSSFTRLTERGCIMRLTSHLADFSSIISLDTLMPPPVLPAQAPMSIRQTRMLLESSGHLSKSAVEKPAVEIMLATWNSALRMISSTVGYILRIFTATAITLAATMPRNQRISSFLNMGFMFFSSMKKYKLKFIENSSRNTLMTYSA